METELNAGDHFDHPGLGGCGLEGSSSRQIWIAMCDQMGDINLGNTNNTSIIDTSDLTLCLRAGVGNYDLLLVSQMFSPDVRLTKTDQICFK